jgi:radical SAM superfamily enzyme YgiQ (UPF0313 family)
MKILLLNPPRSPENKILEYAPQKAKHFIHKKLIGPPLGLLTVAAAVKDFDVTLIDMKGEYDLIPGSPPLNELTLNYLKLYNPDIVGVTFIASEFDYGIEIFKTAKEFNPEILTVAGGLHTTIRTTDFNNQYVDIIAPGQSAGIFREIVIAKQKNTSINEIGGIFIKKGNDIIQTNVPVKFWNSAGDNFIMPDRSLLNRWISTYKVGKNKFPSTYLFTSLGCPFECNFCSIWKQFDGKFHQREIESIISEIKMLDDYPAVRFSDANTIVNVEFINRLFDRIMEEGIKKEFIMDIRFDTAAKHPELINKLAKGGLKVVICGFESFRDSELKLYNKSSSAKYIEKAINIFHDNGIMLRGNYVVPPDYGEDDFKALSDYANSHKVTYAGYTILTPMPGTPYYETVKQDIIDFDLKKYNFFNSVLKTKLPLEKFYENVGKLWLIKKGSDVI